MTAAPAGWRYIRALDDARAQLGPRRGMSRGEWLDLYRRVRVEHTEWWRAHPLTGEVGALYGVRIIRSRRVGTGL